MHLSPFSLMFLPRSMPYVGPCTKVVLAASLLTLLGGLSRQSLTLGAPAIPPEPFITAEDPRTEAVSRSIDQATSRQLVGDFADRVVVATYEELVVRSEELVATVNAFISNPTDQTLQAARESWITARFPWEQSEAFAFGPADSLGYDGALDDWPVNEADVLAVINSEEELTPEYIATLQTTQQGFHAIEFILFGVENDKTVDDFSERELAYLQAATIAFDQTAKALLQSWVTGIDGNPPYRQVLATAGDSSNPAYLTANAAVEEIVQGMLGCLDEVANEKIGEPLETKDTVTLESRFSQTTLNDLHNNLLSVRNAYLGSISASDTGYSLSAWVAEQNPALDDQIKRELEAAIDAVAAIPGPVETNLEEADTIAQMEAAQAAILQVFNTLQSEVLPQVQAG
ncbi:imelysin family protein [Thermocoleostomius sinensis]|uniref:Peptidase M75 n=1 Tax=Thermocoleostomius sinensis A174 TaxID=2016057 RepID=A0A9E8ZB60_9CYAN|nr:imelysin family protein [Thermocoleostomius sinensis]WAL59572.1 peptidase M75 [Thermocoleostomius sinensis A174]